MSTSSDIGGPVAALFGKTRLEVMGLLFNDPAKSFYLRQVAQRTGAGLGAVQRELKQLHAAGIIHRRVDGRQVHFQADPHCPIFEELKALMAKSAGLRDVLAEALSPLADRIKLALVFGSMAAGRAQSDSDVDLLVLGKVSSAEVVAALGKAQDRLAREINPVVYPVTEFREKARSGGGFVERVMTGPQIFIMGDEDELKGLAKKRLARRSPRKS